MLQAVKYKHLTRRHPAYQVGYWRRLRAFHEGGRALLADDELMDEVFPRHAAERGEIYAERKRRAVYVNYAGFLCHQLRAHLFADPLTVTREPAQREAAFYEAFLADCSPRGGKRTAWETLLREQVTQAMVMQTAWTLVSLPATDGSYGSRAEEEAAGALQVYAVPVPAESVINWHDEGDGALQWALIYYTEKNRSSLDYDDQVTRHVYEYYTAESWARFVVEEGPDRKQPAPDDVIHAADGGAHTCGRVPLVRLQLPASQWVMDRLESVVRGGFNKENALYWAEYKALFSQLYEFRERDMPGIDEAIGQNTSVKDIVSQPRGPGYAQIRYKGEDARYITPDTSAFTHARESLKDLRAEMSRVLHALSLSADVSLNALRRTAESKRMDLQPMTAFLGELGRMAREHTVDVLDLAARARGDHGMRFVAGGLEEFDPIAVGDLVEQALLVSQLDLPSSTFQRRYKGRVMRTVLGIDADEDTVQAIQRELEVTTTPEQLSGMPPHDLGDMG